MAALIPIFRPRRRPWTARQHGAVRLSSPPQLALSNMPAATDDGVWIDPAAGVVESRPRDGVRLFRVHGRHTVAIFASAPDWHEPVQRHRERCHDWDPINPFVSDDSKLAPNSFSCLYRKLRAANILSDFNTRFAEGLADAFNVSKACQGRRLREDLWQSYFTGETRSWLLALHSEMTHDTFHSDGCERSPRHRRSRPSRAAGSRAWRGGRRRACATF